MRRIQCSSAPGAEVPALVPWTSLRIPEEWQAVLSIVSGTPTALPAQARAISESAILGSRRNLVVSAPTNSGKSLIGLLVMLGAVRSRKRALLLEPLREVAREKYIELDAMAPAIAAALGVNFSVTLTTGDYRLDEETLSDPPPGQGELIIATPERVEVILRQRSHDAWFDSIGAICVDEAHLLASPRRGPALEYVLTLAQSRAAPPRLVLLSATVGAPEALQEWLEPCDSLSVSGRYPSLELSVGALEPDEKADDVVLEHVNESLRDPDARVLVFVYQTASAEKLAARLSAHLSASLDVANIAAAYHARMSAASRLEARRQFDSGNLRVVVCTTALAMGVNLPASHVVVRDTTFMPDGKLGVGELMQMTGRAGRGSRPGQALVLVRPTDRWNPDELAAAMSSGEVPSIASSFSAQRGSVEDAARLVASLLCRVNEPMSIESVESFFSKSFGARQLVSVVNGALRWLAAPEQVLAFRNDQGMFSLTTLGKAVTEGALPLRAGAGIGQLIRDLLVTDAQDVALDQWKTLDHLLLTELVTERVVGPGIKGPIRERVDDWMEGHSTEVPVLYRRWIRVGGPKDGAQQVLGSLGHRLASVTGSSAMEAQDLCYQATARAIVLLERSRGVETRALDAVWGLELGEVDERWRDNALWLLCGMSRLLDVRCFFYHLKSDCEADDVRVARVKDRLAVLEGQVRELLDQLTFVSPLGSVLHSMRRSTGVNGEQRVGVRTIRLLEEAGIRSVSQLAGFDADRLVGLGVRRDLAKQVVSYMRRRMA